MSRKDSEQVADDLKVHGVKAGCYHADMSAAHRTQIHHKWLSGNVQVRPQIMYYMYSWGWCMQPLVLEVSTQDPMQLQEVSIQDPSLTVSRLECRRLLHV